MMRTPAMEIRLRSFLVGLAFTTAPALANEDVEFGAYLSSECVTCHQSTANGKIPVLAGRSQEEIISALGAFRSGERVSSVMQQIAARLSEAEMLALAAYFASLATSTECKDTTQQLGLPC
ncbi:MAG: cytochrome c [Hyphomicrobium sp.]|jgi:cytochrome c553